MPSPKKPVATTSPIREKNHSPYRDSPSRRQRDIETGGHYRSQNLPYSPSRHRRKHSRPYSPGPYAGEDEPIMASHTPPQDLNRKKSLVRPERKRIDRDHPNYHYIQHAQNMEIYPSSTGADPVHEDYMERRSMASDVANYRLELEPSYADEPVDDDERGRTGRRRKLARRQHTHNYEEKEKPRDLDVIRPPSVWNIYCAVVTFWAPDAILKCFGMPEKLQRRAWREKIGLVSLIMVICACVGFLTFGFTQAVCGTPGLRLKINHVDSGYMIFHGEAYNLDQSTHPAAEGIPNRANVLYDLPHKYGGQDGSFMFQNVNGACKDLIKRANKSDVPTNNNGELAWYFPCTAFNQDGSSQPNFTWPYYTGYACHTTASSRDTFYSLRKAGEVFFTWDDIRNRSRNLMVYSGSVVDLDLLRWFNHSEVLVPEQFERLRTNPDVRGLDITHILQSPEDRRIGQCLTEIIKVGSIDTETVGCIASKVVLYVSLVFILAIVLSKFFLALAFRWFIAWKYAAAKTSQTSNLKKRREQIENWTDDIYAPAPRIADPASTVSGSDHPGSKRGSVLFPQTSRFTSPYAVERGVKSLRPPPTTMSNQSSKVGLVQSQGSIYQHGYSNSLGNLEPSSRYSAAASHSSMLLPETDPQNAITYGEPVHEQAGGFIHDNVVPQPPPEYQPYGFPLAHAICLVTAYSEGAEGLRTTLDSIATTDYPNSHKCLFVVCDGNVKGKDELLTTPDIVRSMMGDLVITAEDVQAYSYVAVASGSKRHNMAKVYAGFYDYGDDSNIPPEKQQRVPMLLIVKCGTPDEANDSKPGNRGKRDSQIILMAFLQRVMFDERMTELEYEMFNGMWRVTGMPPDFYEVVQMVDADTKVFPDSLTHMVSAMVKDPEIMGLCGETKIANKGASWVSMIQVFEYFISHHLSKSFESVFGGVTCLPGCFCMYRIKAPKGGQSYWVPILANPDVVEHYSENVVDTLHKKNLYLLGEDRYLSTLMLRTFPKRKQVFVPQAVCKTTVPEEFQVLLSQRRRWINSTVHNLMELILVRDLCGTFCFSMQFVVFIELIGTLVLPAAIAFTVYLVIVSIVRRPVPIIPLVLLALILGLPAVLIVLTAQRWSYVFWMLIYLCSLPIWNFVLPVYSYWKFDDFSWGETRKTAGEKTRKAGLEYEGEFDSTKITMKRWVDFENEKSTALRNVNTTHHSTAMIARPASSIYEPYRDY